MLLFRPIAALGAVAAMALAAACSPRPADPPASPGKAAGAPPPCPAEHLSCGLQTPVRSDGLRPFENDGMGLRAIFPEDSQVCLARSGDAARGFFAIYDGGPPACPERPERPPRFITLHASYNALFHPSVEKAVPGCRPLPEALRRRLGAPLPAFRGHASIICDETVTDGAIEIAVHALAGAWTDDGAPGSTPSAHYFAALGTTSEHLEEDVARFRRVLAGARIGLPAS